MTDIVTKNGESITRQAERPKPVVVYLQGHPAMASSLRSVLAVLGHGENPDAVNQIPIVEFPWEDLRYEHVETIRSKLIETYAPTTGRKALVAVRGVLKTAWKMRVIDRETYERAIDVDPISGDGEPAGRMLTPDEIGRMFDVANRRDAVIVAVATYAGLRRVELSRLDLSDFVMDDVGGLYLRVRKGKGDKYRDVFLSADIQPFITRWLTQRGVEPGPFLYPSARGGHVRKGRLSISGVWRAIESVSQRARIDPPITPHDFRRTYASTLLDGGVDLPTVQKLMGHADPATTGKYDRRGDAPKKRAADVLASAFRRI